MPEPLLQPTAQDLLSARRGSVVAAAGCGKTELIADTVKEGDGKTLILTHTHAGIAALRGRLRRKTVSSSKFKLDTLAGWALRFAAAYPVRSGLALSTPAKPSDWLAVYGAALRLLKTKSVDRVIAGSYCRVLVDEYQDCDQTQHALICELARILPTCVVGDDLQAIFDFGGSTPVDWADHVFPHFPQIGELRRPWRWENEGSHDLARWLAIVRQLIESEQRIDLRDPPDCVEWKWLPDQEGPKQGTILNACRTKSNDTGSIVLICDPTNENLRAALAKRAASLGFSNIEAVDCKLLYGLAAALDGTNGQNKLNALLRYIPKFISGTEPTPFRQAIESHQSGKRAGRAKFGELIDIALSISTNGLLSDCLALIDGFASRSGARVYRRELMSASRKALTIAHTEPGTTVSEAAWRVQNTRRHAGRIIPARGVGSTLLIKGLEFEHAIVVHSNSMNFRDWYVALTRASKSITVLSPSNNFTVQ